MLRYDDPRLLDDIKGIKWPDENPKGHERSTLLYPLMAQGQPFIFTCWVSFDDATAHWKKVYSGSLQREQIVWQEMKWNLTFEQDKKNERQLNLTFPLTDSTKYKRMYTHNETLYLHYLMETPNIYDKETNFTANP